MSSAEMPATRRLFFALWPDGELRKQLALWLDEHVPRHAGRRVATENLHATLAFLGSVDAGRQTCIERAADAIRGEAFELQLDQVGYFRRPQVIWLGCSVIPPALSALAGALAAAGTACGIDMDARPFAAHLTVVRKARRPVAASLAPLAWRVTRFVLAESVTASAGVRYQVLREWSLRGG